MVRNAIWIGITIAVFFIGIGVNSAIFSATYNPSTMKFANQDLFDQMISDNPKMTSQWMESAMLVPQSNQQKMEQMNDMMNDPKLRKQMMYYMMQNQEFMQDLMQNNQMMDMMKNMMDSGVMSDSSMSNMPFNLDAPITIPMIDGYYNGNKVYFIHTEISDKDTADMMTMMVNFPTLYVPELTNILTDDLSKVYIFTNGISGTGPYGGGPFFFQIDIFDAIPGQDGYSQLRNPHLVTWSENSSPRLLTSVEDLFEAEANGELSIEKSDLVVNAPMIVWKSDGMEQRATMIQRMFESMTDVEGEVINIDTDNYIAMFKLHLDDKMGMMDMMN